MACALAWLAGAGSALAAPTVVLLSLDGVRHDFPERDALPAFTRLARHGARAESLTPAFPSITFPAHATLATGAHPDRHGIVNNHFVTPDGRELRYGGTGAALEAEPLWSAAERQGVRAATFFWPLSEGVQRGKPQTYRRAPFDDELPESAKVDQILAWLDLPEPARPRLVMSWWHGADGAGHENGPEAEETRAALREQDVQLARLLAGIDERQRWSELTLLVVSDHGMRAAEDVVDARDLLESTGIQGRAINGSAIAFVYLTDRSTAAAAQAAQRLAAAEPRIRAFARSALPQPLRLAHPNAGDVVLLAEPPIAFLEAFEGLDLLRRAAWLWGGEVGVHGYDPERHPQMRGIFYALGRGVPAGTRLGRVRALDVAATVARLLGISPPAQSEGTPIAGIGSGAAIAPPSTR